MDDGRFRVPREPARIDDWWRAGLARGPARLVLIDNGREWTFVQLEERAAGIAGGLVAQGAGKGSRIGILFPNRAEWLACWLAATRIGGIAVTLSTFFAPPELAFTLHHADVTHLLCARGYLDHRYDARLAAAFPALAEADGAVPLALEAAPHLRGVWFDAPVEARWTAGTLDDLASSAQGCARAAPPMIEAMRAAVSSADSAMMIYTSGSTAAPKGVVHSQATVARKIAFMAAANSLIPLDVEPGDRLLINSPLFWVGGFLTAKSGLTRDAALIFDDDHSPKAMLRAVRELGATSVSGAESVLRNMRDLEDFRDEDLARLKPQHTSQLAFFNRFAGPDHPRLTNSLGMTETLGPHSGDPGFVLPPEIGENTFGFALDGMELRIVDPASGAPVPAGEPGELCVRGVWLMEGFYKRERRDCFDADGFYHTGDKCRLMPEGRLLFEGRLGGMIKTSGANVSPEEVELALLDHSGILEAAVFGMPDPGRDEIVVAVIVPASGSGLDEEAVRQWVKARLSSFKVPRRVLFHQSTQLPRTPSNKIRKPALADMVRNDIR